MTKEDKVFEIAKAIAPVVAKEGLDLQMRIAKNGGNPENCKVGSRDIPHSYGYTLKVWAKAFVEELENEE